ncbi:hypothetical protein M3T53_00690 [Actinomyces sp. B33]|uniref:hypothetical protein n=1 Tax=Actinomyces sp. B33 TaxID=2942131 RepID=UPI00234148E2|nr:hypothetical protein [Actinomyces sp. B33]MDC4232234.1 hypothetical protein [Actinomyces sp. B33]
MRTIAFLFLPVLLLLLFGLVANAIHVAHTQGLRGALGDLGEIWLRIMQIRVPNSTLLTVQGVLVFTLLGLSSIENLTSESLPLDKRINVEWFETQKRILRKLSENDFLLSVAGVISAGVAAVSWIGFINRLLASATPPDWESALLAAILFSVLYGTVFFLFVAESERSRLVSETFLRLVDVHHAIVDVRAVTSDPHPSRGGGISMWTMRRGRDLLSLPDEVVDKLEAEEDPPAQRSPADSDGREASLPWRLLFTSAAARSFPAVGLSIPLLVGILLLSVGSARPAHRVILALLAAALFIAVLFIVSIVFLIEALYLRIAQRSFASEYFLSWTIFILVILLWPISVLKILVIDSSTAPALLWVSVGFAFAPFVSWARFLIDPLRDTRSPTIRAIIDHAEKVLHEERDRLIDALRRARKKSR